MGDFDEIRELLARMNCDCGYLVGISNVDGRAISFGVADCTKDTDPNVSAQRLRKFAEHFTDLAVQTAFSDGYSFCNSKENEK
jgi:hypothetical protein